MAHAVLTRLKPEVVLALALGN